MSMSPTNGHVSDVQPIMSVTDAIEEHVRGLEQLLVPLRAERDQLRAQLADLTAREKGIAHAIGALRPGRAPAEEPKAPKPGTWTPSEERLEVVFRLFAAEPEPISPTQLAEKTPGLGTETASKCAKILRERELIRKAAAIRGGGSSYTVMPGAEWPAT